ncbi:MAG TPA: NUDIX domain-containing protein [Pyrinomonadaceae bacterium]|nr:NUDIX domain-containing protein [Pyrinomonadaceae bacterium]
MNNQTLPRIGSAVLVRDGANRILLGKRNKDPQRGSWILPGGKIHPFESIGEAAARELREETGLDIEVSAQFRVYEVINPPDEHRIVIYSWAKLLGGTAVASDDISEVQFFSPDRLEDLQTSPLVRRVLIDAGVMRKDTDEMPPRIQLDLFKAVGSCSNTPAKTKRYCAVRKGLKPRLTKILELAPTLFGT